MTPIQFETYVKELSEDKKPKIEIFTTNKILKIRYR